MGHFSSESFVLEFQGWCHPIFWNQVPSDKWLRDTENYVIQSWKPRWGSQGVYQVDWRISPPSSFCWKTIDDIAGSFCCFGFGSPFHQKTKITERSYSFEQLKFATIEEEITSISDKLILVLCGDYMEDYEVVKLTVRSQAMISLSQPLLKI